ncbi:MAG: membrane-bound lytic murein transglycosylase MltF [Pseudomonadota bacterium]|nr:membrane-bound lytic murein transglycosylase MltF [Pseudomonadota bacterium]
MINFIYRFLLISLIIGILINVFSNYIFKRNHLETIIAKNQINFITRIGPTTYYQNKGVSAGFEYELMKDFSEYLGVELNIMTEESINKMILNLNNNTADIGVGLAATKNKKEKLSFTYPYNRIDQVLVYNSDTRNRPKNIQDVLSGTIEVQKLSNHEEILNSLKLNHPKLKWISLENINTDELIELVNEGMIDYTILNSNEFEIYSQFYPNIKSAFKVSTSEPVAWALSLYNDGSLVNKLKEFFEYSINNNRLSTLFEKHFGHLNTFSFVGSKQFLRDIVLILPKYEQTFRDAAEEYNLDWRLIASVAYQESRWREDAVSYTGVRGLMMLTKNTAEYLGVKNRTDPFESISGGTKYLSLLLKRFPKDVLEPDRTWFALAAYNLGYGHVTDAFQLARNQNRNPYNWLEMKPILLQLSKSQYYKTTKYGYARGWEALKYVQNIRQYYDILVFLDSKDDEKKKKIINDRIPQSL